MYCPQIQYIGSLFPCIAVSRDGKLVAVSSYDSSTFAGSINLFDATTGHMFPIDCECCHMHQLHVHIVNQLRVHIVHLSACLHLWWATA